MGGNKTPIIDEDQVFRGRPSWVEQYHSHLMAGGKPLAFDAAPGFLRRLTVDEALRLQTFPNEYKFAGAQGHVFTQIGNAVPCNLAKAVGLVAKDILGDEFDDLMASFEASTGPNHQRQLDLATSA